jgi:hypothetical protein
MLLIETATFIMGYQAMIATNHRNRPPRLQRWAVSSSKAGNARPSARTRWQFVSRHYREEYAGWIPFDAVCDDNGDEVNIRAACLSAARLLEVFAGQ